MPASTPQTSAEFPAAEAGAPAVPWGNPAVLLATCGWIGRLPVAPGTGGAAAGAVAAAGIAWLGLPLAGEACLLAAINALGVPICTRAARLLGRGSDPGAIVYDEAASLPLALLVVPAAQRTAGLLLVAFLLHRLFDIWKIFPCRHLERLPAGLGIMADDWGAAGWVAVLLATGRWNGWC